jgi:hypothetical protein
MGTLSILIRLKALDCAQVSPVPQKIFRSSFPLWRPVSFLTLISLEG